MTEEIKTEKTNDKEAVETPTVQPANRTVRRRSRMNQIRRARQSHEYKHAVSAVENEPKIQLTKKELDDIQDIAETPKEAEKMEQDAIAAKTNIAALRHAKTQVNKSVPSEKLIEKPGFGPITATAEYHTDQSFRFLLGREQYMAVVDGKKQRKNQIIGLFEAAAAIKHIEQGYQAGCPYAAWTLVRIEEKMEQLKVLFAKSKEEADKLIENTMLISTQPFTSKSPAIIQLDFISTYAYHFANFLLQYDLLLRPLVSGKILGFISDEEFRKVERKMGTPLRSLFRLVNEWEYVGQEAVTAKNAKFMEAEHKMGILPKEIVNSEIRPKIAKMPKLASEQV